MTESAPRQDLAALAALGLFVRRGVIEPDVCRALRQAARVASSQRATIVRDQGDSVVDERHRRTKSVDVDEAAAATIVERVAGLRDDLAGHFGLALTGHQEPQFLLYRRGDFFRAHSDNSGARNLDDYIRERRVSVVVFLADQATRPEPEAFCGGELRFFMLDPRATPANARTVVRGEAGLVVAFRSETYHEVAPVTAGERLTVVTWMVGPDPAEGP
jgi:SM-20-related protein